MKISSTKTYGHEMGLSCVFRQHRAQSHCRFLHGYALSVKFKFDTNELDQYGWVMDFGGLEDLKKHLVITFDHTLLVAEDDPMLDELSGLSGLGIADVIVVPATGCEAFAKQIFDFTKKWLDAKEHSPRVWLSSVEVKEHGANSAIYSNPFVE